MIVRLQAKAGDAPIRDRPDLTPRPPLAILDPRQEPGWDAQLAGHPDSSFFHTAAWAEVLYRTYGHRPAYCCQFDRDRLTGLLPVMGVSSPFTGRRGVSLPFTDSCLRLKARDRDPGELYRLALEHGRKQHWRYLECRGGDHDWPGSVPSLAFHGHVVDLDQRSGALFGRFDGAMRRSIRKAVAAGVQIEFCRDAEAIGDFYALHCQTRRRHGLPPQPVRFFRNIAESVLGSGHGFVAMARLQRIPVAAAVFFHWGRKALYKFGASDYACQRMRANNLLMWKTLERLAGEGFTALDLGRTSLANEGLRRFKLSLGAREESITYCKYDLVRDRFVTDSDRAEGWHNRVFRCLPTPLLRLAGHVLYPHLS